MYLRTIHVLVVYDWAKAHDPLEEEYIADVVCNDSKKCWLCFNRIIWLALEEIHDSIDDKDYIKEEQGIDVFFFQYFWITDCVW